MIIKIKNSFFLLITMILIISLFIIVLSGFSKSTKAATLQENNKYYTCILVEKGDTLWDIAKEYRTEEYNSINSLIKEIKELNNLPTEHISSGQSIVIPYYSSEQK